MELNFHWSPLQMIPASSYWHPTLHQHTSQAHYSPIRHHLRPYTASAPHLLPHKCSHRHSEVIQARLPSTGCWVWSLNWSQWLQLWLIHMTSATSEDLRHQRHQCIPECGPYRRWGSPITTGKNWCIEQLIIWKLTTCFTEKARRGEKKRPTS